MNAGFFIGFILIDTILITLMILTVLAERPKVPVPKEPDYNETRWE